VGDHILKGLAVKTGLALHAEAVRGTLSVGREVKRKFRLGAMTVLLRVENAFIFFFNELRNRDSRFSCE
jgi:hypothetical protein